MSKVNARRRILDAAQQLMTGRGYSATTVDEIIGMAGVSKGSFYHAFKSKEELAISALEDYEERGRAILGGGAYREVEDPVEKALAFVSFVEEKSQELWAHGCMLGSVAIEVAQSYPSVIRRIDELFDAFEAEMEAVLAPALKARGITDVSARELSVHLLGVIEGSIIVAKSHFQADWLPRGIGHFRRYLQLLLAV